MTVVALSAVLYRPASGDEPRHANPLPDQPSSLVIGHCRVGEHVEDLIEQPRSIRLRLGTVDQALGQLVPDAGIRPGKRLIEQLHQLVEHLDVGLGQRRQQHRMPTVDIGALQCLVGRGPSDLGQHPAPARR